MTDRTTIRWGHLANRAIASILLLFAAGCGEISIPGVASKHSTVPAQAVNESSLGIIRIRFKGTSAGVQVSQRQALEDWLKRHGMECPKVGYLLEQLAKLGYDTALAVIPGDTAILDDAGFYVGGPEGKSPEELEDVFIKVGGFGIGGLTASKLQVIPIGHGWYFVGINGDGVIDGANDSSAERMSEILEHVGDRPACVVIPIEGLDASIEQLAADDQSRIIRRLRAVAQALDNSIAIAAGVSDTGRTEVMIIFRDQDSAAALDKAFARIRKDMELALQGSIEQKEVTSAEAERDRQIIAHLRTEQQGNKVLLYIEK